MSRENVEVGGRGYAIALLAYLDPGDPGKGLSTLAILSWIDQQS